MRYTVGDRIRAELKKTGHTQRELARETGHEPAYISKILNGRKSSPKVLADIDAQLYHWRVVQSRMKRRKKR